jgi:hypothetical protein
MLIREIFEDQSPVAPLNRPLPDRPTDADLAQLGPDAEVIMAITQDSGTRAAMKALANKISRKEQQSDSQTYRDAPYLQLVTSMNQHPEFQDEYRRIGTTAMRKRAQQQQAQQAAQQRPGSSSATIKPTGTIAPQ